MLMFMPAKYMWLEPVLIGALIVFVIDLIGNMISFSNRFLNALVTAIVFAVIFSALIYSGVGKVEVRSTATTAPGTAAPAKK
jgi:ABC-type Fe3+-siderophore transport system permease subunit